ncbi:hypothetical protein EMCRGX_G033233 [Ephydatia muelleri]
MLPLSQGMDLGLLTDQLLPNDWTPLFEGQLSELEPMLDPSTGIPDSLPATSVSRGMMTASGLSLLDSTCSIKLIEETQRLERQQKLQQQKLFELQQTLLKTEILKNQLQIASISKSQGVNTTTSLLSALRTAEAPVTVMATSRPSPQQQQVASMSYELLAEGTSGGLRDLLPLPTLQQQQSLRSLSPSPTLAPELLQDDNDDIPEPDRRKVHNLIEKKYRTSINDRIGTLREIVARHTRDNKRLQKSAVLQKTIDYIRYLEKNVKVLHEENQQLRQTLGKAPAGKLNLTLVSAPNTPPSRQISPHQSESEQDSGHPSSPEDLFTDMSAQDYKFSLLARLASSTNGRPSAASHGLLCVLMAMLFFVGPLSITKGHAPQLHAGSRVLSGFESGDQTPLDTAVYWTYWAVWLLVAMVCYGLVTMRALPRASTNARSVSKFWQHKGQAEKHLQMGQLLKARDSLEMLLQDIGRPLPNSYLSLCVDMCWSVLQHILFQAMIGQWAVALASFFVKKPQQAEVSSKKERFGVTAADIAEAYHFLHQVNMALSGGRGLRGISFYTGINAINFAKLDTPFSLLQPGHLAEMYFTLGLQCHFSIPHWSRPLMWYYFHCSRASGLATPHKWMATPQGRSYLMGTSWSLEVTGASRLYHGVATLPMCSIARAYSKQLLHDAFSLLLFPESSAHQGDGYQGEAALTTLRQVHHLAEEARSMLHANMKSLGTVVDTSDSGFDVIEWWASIGLVACYWYMGKDSLAQEHYASIDGISGDSSPVRTALYQSFMAARLHHPTTKDVQPPVEHLLQLCTLTSDILKTCVRDVLQENSNTAEGGLHQLGLLLACEWLLQLRTAIWEEHCHVESVRRTLVHSFTQDVDTMSHLVKLLPQARPKLHLYKGFESSIAGANPLHTQLLLSCTGRSASLRRRHHQSKETGSRSVTSIPEHAMAKVFAYKHLPRSLEVPGGVTGGDMLMKCCQDTGQVISQTNKVAGPTTQTAV